MSVVQRTSVVLVVPDGADSQLLHDMMHVLLSELRLSFVMPLNEPASCVFGAGVPTAAVVHMGAARCWVACVEDCNTLAHTRCANEENVYSRSKY